MCDEFQALFSGIFLLEVATVNYNLHFAERRDSENFCFFSGLRVCNVFVRCLTTASKTRTGCGNLNWVVLEQLTSGGGNAQPPPSILKSQMVHINTLCGLRNHK